MENQNIEKNVRKLAKDVRGQEKAMEKCRTKGVLTLDRNEVRYTSKLARWLPDQINI